MTPRLSWKVICTSCGRPLTIHNMIGPVLRDHAQSMEIHIEPHDCRMTSHDTISEELIKVVHGGLVQGYEPEEISVKWGISMVNVRRAMVELDHRGVEV